MAQLITRSIAAGQRAFTSRPVLVLSNKLSCNVETNSSIANRRPQLPPLMTGPSIDERIAVPRVGLQNSTTPHRINTDHGLQFMSDSKEAKKSEEGKNFIAKDIVDKQEQASLDQLIKVADVMNYHLPRFFNEPHPFSLYTKDMVFIDNIRQTKMEGFAPYATRLALIKLYYRLRYSQVSCEVLNLVKHPEESCVRIRWRIISKPGMLQFLVLFFRFHSTERWTDGVSTLHVNSDGKIYCHVCDNIDVDEGKTEIKKTIKNPLVNRGLNV